MSDTEEFPLGDVLSWITGKMVSLNGIEGPWALANWMTGVDLHTHQLVRAGEACGRELRTQFPKLRAIHVPEFRGDEVFLRQWLTRLERRHGKLLRVERPKAGFYEAMNPLEELLRMRQR